MVNVYEILGIDPNASAQDINRMIAKHEVNQTLKPEVVTKIRLVLLNPVKRQAYNAQLFGGHSTAPIQHTTHTHHTAPTHSSNSSQHLHSAATPVTAAATPTSPYQSTILYPPQSKGIKLKKHQRKKKTAAGEYRVRKWLFMLCAFCLGGFGLHWFVAGNYKRGGIYFGVSFLTIVLLFFYLLRHPHADPFIPAIMAWASLFDMIRAAFKRKDADGYIRV
ncbi:hypothetical protein LVJ82_02425 [Vitreoscilla massiliensis]|uniref:J domain-containing protein n=1 Tax=Vitreoscilla massiliensis TaxID=1689272 RepID=A0ABY4E3G1_9NEIS|nr:hypothetical protein [Vitreoscilla massiliensis]UOO89863.1 hypothetical protein LVJ82_02425 [Vitreoscilla massiliensis]